MDKTQHIKEQHPLFVNLGIEPKEHSARWYAYWDKKCPDCGVEAESTL